MLFRKTVKNNNVEPLEHYDCITITGLLNIYRIFLTHYNNLRTKSPAMLLSPGSMESHLQTFNDRSGSYEGLEMSAGFGPA